MGFHFASVENWTNNGAKAFPDVPTPYIIPAAVPSHFLGKLQR